MATPAPKTLPAPELVHHHDTEDMDQHYYELVAGGRQLGFLLAIDCGHEVWIDELRTRPESDGRGHGYATRLLTALLDQHGHRVIALANPPKLGEPDGLTNEQRAAWYARHGFHFDAPGENRMTRLPTI